MREFIPGQQKTRLLAAMVGFFVGLFLTSGAFAEPQINGGAPTLQDAALKFAALQTIPVAVSVEEVTAEPGKTGLEVSVDDAAGIAGGGLTLTYESSVMTATVTSSSGISLFSQRPSEGNPVAGRTGMRCIQH